MTPLPKKKHTRARTGKRKNSATESLRLEVLTKCTSCGKPRRSHVACPHCGFYKIQAA